MKNSQLFDHKPKRRRLRPVGVAVVVAVVVCAAAAVYTVSAHTPLSQGTQAASVSKTKSTSSKTAASHISASSQALTPTQIAASHLPTVQVSLADAVKPLWVHVQLSTQNVVVYDAQNRVVEAFVCSSGSAGNDTPTGTYTVKDRGESFYNPKYQEGAYNWVRFNGSYLFHSVPFDASRNIVPEQVAELGEPSSHGCIHLSMDDSKWIYDNIPRGTKVVIE
ncbi:MAG: L,D-transpeptidase [Ethanoligenens sp.]